MVSFMGDISCIRIYVSRTEEDSHKLFLHKSQHVDSEFANTIAVCWHVIEGMVLLEDTS